MKLLNDGRTLRIRAVEPDDAAWLAQTWANREFVSLYCSNIEPSPVETLREALIARQDVPVEALGFVEFIVERLNGEPIGIGSLGNYATQHRRAELMIGIVDRARRHGTAGLEATLLLLDLAFNNYRLNKVFSYVYAYNDYSETNTLKLGFVQEGRLRQHHWLAEEGRFVDLYTNGMTLDDFRRLPQLARWSRRLLGRDITRPPIICQTGEAVPLDAAMRGRLLAALAQIPPCNDANAPLPLVQ